jgi:hypothetical protein
MPDKHIDRSNHFRLPPNRVARNELARQKRYDRIVRELLAAGRDDLGDRVVAGELSLYGALRIAKRDHYAALIAAWNACNNTQRAVFAANIERMLSGQP